jgi:hypothetical protein
MRTPSKLVATVTLAGALVSATMLPASAACTRLGASVNDFGKDGPTQDAKVLLDKYIAKWATDHGVAKYKTGTKEVKCELYLNLLVVDEHTCRAEAMVCWDGAPVTPAVTATAKDGAEKPIGEATATPAIKKSVARVAPKAVTEDTTVSSGQTATLPANASVTAAPATAAPPAPVAKPANPAPKAAAAADNAVATQAMAAAEKAAAAAERAAAAAERAAAAAGAVERATPTAKP